MKFCLSILILAAVCFFVFFKIPQLIRKRKLEKSPIYEVEQPKLKPTYFCLKCNRPLILVPVGKEGKTGELWCSHCHSYYNLKQGDKICSPFDAQNVTKN